MTARDAIVRALELIGDGDQAGAVLVLLAALEDVPAEHIGHAAVQALRDALRESQPPARRRPPVCPICGAKAWPGDDVGHVWSLHHHAGEVAA